jgi:short-subunit dehydrogenase
LRAEVGQKDITITIVCPPSVKTDLRKYDLALSLKSKKKEEENEGDGPVDTRIEVEECVKIIIEAADRKARRIYFPLRAYIGVYLRPFFPDIVDHFALKEAKL